MPLEQIAEQGSPGLAAAIELYREREGCAPLDQFNARI
jgi:hypothetical protein